MRQEQETSLAMPPAHQFASETNPAIVKGGLSYTSIIQGGDQWHELRDLCRGGVHLLPGSVEESVR